MSSLWYQDDAVIYDGDAIVYCDECPCDMPPSESSGSASEPVDCHDLTCADFAARDWEAYGAETIALDGDGQDLTYPCFDGIPAELRLAGGEGATYAVLLWCNEGQGPGGTDLLGWIWVEHDGAGGQVECGDNSTPDCDQWESEDPIDTGIVGQFGVREV